jgi:hypothetical protein
VKPSILNPSVTTDIFYSRTTCFVAFANKYWTIISDNYPSL